MTHVLDILVHDQGDTLLWGFWQRNQMVMAESTGGSSLLISRPGSKRRRKGAGVPQSPLKPVSSGQRTSHSQRFHHLPVAPPRGLTFTHGPLGDIYIQTLAELCTKGWKHPVSAGEAQRSPECGWCRLLCPSVFSR